MPALKTILIVDDNQVNRAILAKILSVEYAVLEAENGLEALEILSGRAEEIAAVMLDLIMPVMDGYAFLQTIASDGRYGNLPIIVTTENTDNSNEIKALELGAWDFVSKPYNPKIIQFRLKNAIDRSQLSALKQLKYLADYDELTGIYNKTNYFAATREMIDANRDETFAFLRFDVDRFQLINSFFGMSEGNNLLIYLANHLKSDIAKNEKTTYGRIESDVFSWCLPYDEHSIISMIKRSKETLEKYNPNYDIVPSIGIYVVDDRTVSVEEMYNRATLAAKSCKGNYIDYYAYYNESMRVEIAHAQEIVNDMNYALENNQFEVYFQPQYNIHTNLPCGAEVLVRWMHPQKGVLSPSEFIPVFERNGFITKLDYYVWEQACKCLSSWTARRIKPYPISVNISRVNVYNPQFPEKLLELVDRYNVSPALLNLELTESAYSDNPVAMRRTMAQLQSFGFTVMMDDFGSGYSSLGLLKDIEVDVLKIDMRFLAKTEIPGRGENIVASVIRMAKWLNIPVIAEGAETAAQVDFLRSIGCDYVQGFYFARPMSLDDYDKLCEKQPFDVQLNDNKKYCGYRYNDLFSLNKELELLFGNSTQAAAIYEFKDGHVDMIRVNEAYYDLLGHGDMLAKPPDILNLVTEEDCVLLTDAFNACVETKDVCECEYMRRGINGEFRWINTKLHYVSGTGNKHIIVGELIDVTMRKTIDFELQKYRTSLLESDHDPHTVLIVDDAAINRMVLKKILEGKFLFCEAENGEEAIEMLQEMQNKIDLILLDISMPKMDGKEFLQYKKKHPEFDGIPVIMITADDSPEQQISTLSLGANDYIVKPFITEVVTRRVANVIESNHRFKEMVREYFNISEQVKTDLMTGLLNRASAEAVIRQSLEKTSDVSVMLMLDIDNFKNFNDTYGHSYGDKVISTVADTLRSFFRREDIVARMGGDEFAAFLCNVTDIKLIKDKAHRLCKSMREIEIDGKNAEITCSVGMSVSTEENRSFEVLYQNADKALYSAKCKGKNAVSIYGEEQETTSIISWINDTESVLDAINDRIYICDRNNYDLLYVNDCVCQSAGVTREQCRGKKCYELLMHKTAPCEFCSMSKMSESKVYARLFKMPNSSQVFLMRGKNIHRNGMAAHLELAVDVTKIEGMRLEFEAADNE